MTEAKDLKNLFYFFPFIFNETTHCLTFNQPFKNVFPVVHKLKAGQQFSKMKNENSYNSKIQNNKTETYSVTYTPYLTLSQ